ncbi:phosphonate C-P lyase system protein PhnG [Phaeobacter sp. 22II1-1F12B]|uniref:phosphonate C-P lyase system protein PhnG n=1 Tax=Phaeobacter sp. 22II1-1F12B TaxID=1317111 RepID=UPI000B5242DB|nr:phosphonate C-P lyase system protein PhnG [Phaeobacter sp. 22II1-1F12B]OWU80668.1 phosphonate metabolism protein PhnG [Phaeobacter sp. 22II1-1F12B]
MAKAEQEKTERQAWMGLLAKSSPARLAALMDTASDMPDFTWLRVPEAGGVMVRGRMGGTGAPFNLGEMTVTRCALRLASGEVGHAYVQGRDKAHAQRAALVDALMQTDRALDLRATVLDPLESEREAQIATRAAKAAATKVDFFTMVRGED